MNQLENEFIKMLHTYKQDFYRLAYSYVKNEQDALDVIGEATFKGYKALKKLKDTNYLRTWFYRIVINESISLLRKRKKELVYDIALIDNIYSKEDISSDIHMDLYDAMEQLSHKHKTIITLKYLEQLKLKEISDVLDMNINTVKTNLKRGLLELETILGGTVND